MRWLIASCTSTWVFAVAASGTFLPLSRADGIEYFFVWPRAGVVVTALPAVALLLALGYCCRRRAAPPPGGSGALDDARTGRWMAPCSLAGAVALGLLPAAPGIGERGAVVGYLLYDLRWWWLAAIVAWTIV